MTEVSDVNLRISGMHCAGCVRTIETGLESLDGVADCAVNLATNSATVNFDGQRVSADRIVSKIGELGYRAEIGQPDLLQANEKELRSAYRRLLQGAVASIPLMFFAMYPMVSETSVINPLIDGVVQAVFAAVVLFLAGWEIVADAAGQLRHGRSNMNTLISLGSLVAFGWSIWALYVTVRGGSEALYFESAGMIVTIILLGRYLEARSRGMAGEAIKALWKLRPDSATAVINGVDVEVETDSIKTGMHLRILPGQRVPADGKIMEGHPAIDESMLTGESLPLDKKIGDPVIGGSLNGNSSFLLEVTATGATSYLASVIRLVADAQARKAPIQRLADRVAGVFVPIVLLLAAVTGVGWYFYSGDWSTLVRFVIAVLIVACPCALGLATPTAVLAGTGRAAREGIIIRGGDVLEQISAVDTVVFDKTGTLTHGELEVVEVTTFGESSQQALVRIVGGLEKHSEHPVARAIGRHLQTQQVEPAVVRDVVTRPGFGLEGICDGRRLLVGNRTLMEGEQVSFGQSLLAGQREMDKGRTVVYVAMDGQITGTFSLSDRVRSDARDVVSHLKDSGRNVIMLTGDNRRTADGVARALGVDNYEAEIRPHQKQVIVDTTRKVGYRIAMVGDGINDAPALAAADVGVAIGAGADVALESADVVLVRSALTDLQKMFRVSKASLKIIRQNLFWAFFYNVIAIPIAAGVLYPSLGLRLSPMMAAAAMSLSSVFVVTNSLRLRRLTL
jgi:Cu+-exporting ATPase